MNFDNQITRELLKIGCKVMPARSFHNIDKVEEYIKWLSYIPERKNKKINKEEQKILTILNKYEKGRYDPEEVIEALNYIGNNSIETIMDNKLTQKEKQEAQKQIEIYINLPNKELEEKINEEDNLETYLELPMIDAYILYYINKIYYRESINELDRDIKNAVAENDIIKVKSIQYAANPYLK